MSPIVLTPLDAPSTGLESASTTILRIPFTRNGELTDPESVTLTDQGATYGVKRLDTGEVVVAAGTVMVRESEGVYTYSFDDPAPGLTYRYSVAALIGAQVYYQEGTTQGGWADFRELASELDRLVVPYAGGAPLPVVHQIEARILRDFCRETEVWEYTYEGETIADDAAIPLVLPPSTHLWRFKSATIDEVQQLVSVLAPGDAGLEFVYAPTEAGLVVAVTVVLVPTLDCVMAPAWLIEQYGDGLVSGVLAYLLGMADKPWYSPKSVEKYFGEFRSAVATACGQALTLRGPARSYAIGGMAI